MHVGVNGLKPTTENPMIGPEINSKGLSKI